MRLDGWHDEAITRLLLHDVRARLQCRAAEARPFLIWRDKDMTWLVPHDGSPGRPAVFLNAAIQVCLTIKVPFKLSVRQATGWVASLLGMATLGKGRARLCDLFPTAADILRPDAILARRWPMNLRVDSTGIKVLGEGERQARKRGTHRLDLKALGERSATRDPDRQSAEIQIRVALMNRFSALGTAETVRVA